MSAPPAVEVSGLTVELGGVTVVQGVDLSVAAGSWTTVIGPNGAGKTTLLRALAGLVPAAGSIRLQGDPLDAMARRQRSRRVAVVPQDPVIPPGMTVAHYVLLGRTARLGPLGRESADDLDAVEQALGRLELRRFAQRPIETLSGGERQRAVLGRALVQDAPVLLLDEPTSALDIGHQHEVLDLVDDLRHRFGLTVLATMHDLTLAAHHADHILLMQAGEVISSGTPDVVLTNASLRVLYGPRFEVIEHRGRPVVVPCPKEDEHART